MGRPTIEHETDPGEEQRYRQQGKPIFCARFAVGSMSGHEAKDKC